MNQILGTLLPIALLILVMYLLIIRPQKKREREVNTMRRNLEVGDNVVTIGGILGKIVKTTEDTIVLQVGHEKVKFELMRWSVSKVLEHPEAKNVKKHVVAEEKEEEEVPEKKLRPKRLQKKNEEAVDETEDKAAEDKGEEGK